jgi:hypothetical protein
MLVGLMYGKHGKKFRDEQAENDAFVRLVGGIKRADRIQQIWRDSYPEGFGGKGLGMNRGKPKEEVFRENAKKEGFTDQQINRFLDLP